MRPKLIRVHVVPVNVVHGWLVSSRDPRWSVGDSHFCRHKATALRWVRKTQAFYPDGFSVRVHGRNGRIQSEFTLPRSKDPRKSRG